MLIGEAVRTNVIVFGLIRPRLEPTMYRTGGKYVNNFAAEHRPYWFFCLFVCFVHYCLINFDNVLCLQNNNTRPTVPQLAKHYTTTDVVFVQFYRVGVL